MRLTALITSLCIISGILTFIAGWTEVITLFKENTVGSIAIAVILLGVIGVFTYMEIKDINK